MHNEARNLNDLEKTERSEEQNKTSVAALNLSRRRLVRGAVVAAPVILTLRSGALAAASCVGVKVVNVSVNQGQLAPGTDAAVGDYCVASATACPDPNQPTKILSGSRDASPIFEDNNQLVCGNTTGNTTVAILSSINATSLLPA